MLRFVPAFIGLSIFGLVVLLYQYDLDAYLDILRFVGIVPWTHPFIDGAFMYAMKACWTHGFDVYISVPCDHDGIPTSSLRMAYSPLWQRLVFLPTNDAARYPIGFVTDTLLLLSLTVLPSARTVRDAVLMSTSAFSTMVCFALERNNIDVWMYLMVIFGGLLYVRGKWLRCPAYALFMLAGLLKYYPLALFGLAIRERPARFFLIAVLCVLVLGLFAASFWHEILEEANNIPAGSPFADFVGITNIPMAMSIDAKRILGAGPWISAVVSFLARVVLTMLVFVWAMRTVRHPAWTRALLDMRDADAVWLVIGCLIMGFCILMGQNVGYRGIYLLIVLSGLLALRRMTQEEAMRRDLDFAAISLVVLMWMEGIRLWLAICSEAFGILPAFDHGIQAVIWGAREYLWLNLERVMIAVLVSFIMTSLAGKQLGFNALPLLLKARKQLNLR